MSIELLVCLTLAVLAVAALYSSVGHAGASGYIAVMTLFGMAPQAIKPTALVLNILVATIATWQFARAGRFTWSLFWPFALLAVPAAFLGGYLSLPVHAFKVLVGAALSFSAVRLAVTPRTPEEDCHPPPTPVALGVGGALGLMAGLTGTGGGIFLTPLLIFMRWARATAAAGVSAPFILLNSVAGLGGNVAATRFLPAFIVPLAVAVIAGGFAGSHLGSRRLPQLAIKRLLAVVLAIAGAKLILT